MIDSLTGTCNFDTLVTTIPSLTVLRTGTQLGLSVGKGAFMKLILVALILISNVFAAEVDTDCPAMNGSREKIVKDSSVKKGRSGSQVVSQ